MTVGWDFDGCLARTPRLSGAPAFGEQDQWQHGPTFTWARRHYIHWGKLLVITGRSVHWTPHITKWLKQEMGDHGEITVHTNGDKWQGWRHCMNIKAQHMRQEGIILYYGDQDHLDGGAAREVGAIYVRVIP
jgi:acid phosphatase class B